MTRQLDVVGDTARRRLVRHVNDVLVTSKNLCWGDELTVQVNFKDDNLGTDVGRIVCTMKFESPPYGKGLLHLLRQLFMQRI